MANWFSFSGVTSTAKGVYVQDFPPATLPEERAEFVDIPGRSGSLTVLEGAAVYDDIILTINCYVRDMTQLDAISAWLRGSGALVLGNMPDRYYVARCVNQIEIAKLLRASGHRTFAAVFRCQPYRYAYPEPPAKTYAASPDSINNPGTADAYPLITIVGSGNVTLTIGSVTLTVTGLASQVTFDTETGFAVDGSGNDLTNTASLSEWPLRIPPGISTVSWTGTVTSVTISRPWRYI